MHMHVGADTCRCSNSLMLTRHVQCAGQATLFAALCPEAALAVSLSAFAIPFPSCLPCRHGVYAEDAPGGEVSTAGHVCRRDGPRHLGQAGIHLQAYTPPAATAALRTLRHNHQQHRAARCCAAWHSQDRPSKSNTCHTGSVPGLLLL